MKCKGPTNTKFVLVDLDGTIIDGRINHTFEFLKSYLGYKYGIMGIVKYRLASLLTLLTSKIVKNHIFLRNMFIKLCIAGLDIRDLIEFTIKFWLPYILHNVNIAVLNFIRDMKNEGYVPITLTSCIEIPAKIISNRLGFEKCIATEFKLLRSFVVGIKNDTYGHLKFEVARKLLGHEQVQQAIYVADVTSIIIEKAESYVNKVYCVIKDNILSIFMK